MPAIRRRLLLTVAFVAGFASLAPAQERGRDASRDAWRGPPPIQLVHQAEARIAALKADLRLTEEQARHWEGFERVLLETSRARIDRLTNADEERRKAREAKEQEAKDEAARAEREREEKREQARAEAQKEAQQKADAQTAKPGEPGRTADTPTPAPVDPAIEPRNGSAGASPDARSADARPAPRRVEIEPRRRDADEVDRRLREAEASRSAARDEDRDDDEPAWDRRGERRAARQDRRTRDRADSDDRPDELAAMVEMSKDVAGRVQELQRVAEGARPLYDSLERRQRERLVRYIHREYAIPGVQQGRR